MTEGGDGWVGWGPGGPSPDLPPDVHDRIRRRQSERRARRGGLLAQVEVRVFENGEAQAQVSFPPGCILTPMDTAEVAEAVRRARDVLADWR